MTEMTEKKQGKKLQFPNKPAYKFSYISSAARPEWYIGLLVSWLVGLFERNNI